MNKDFIKIVEGQDWFIQKARDGWRLCKFSPLGEDFSFYVTDANLTNNVYNYVESFDVNKHAECAYAAASGVNADKTTFIAVADDARAIKADLDKLVAALLSKFPDTRPIKDEDVDDEKTE